MSLLKVNEVQNYNGSSLTLTASTVSTSAQLNTGGNISVTGSINVSDDSTTRSNLGLGSIATQDSSNVTITGGNISNATLASSVTFPALGDAAVGTVSESSGTPTGDVIESGSNANGEYVKFADGTLICFKDAFTVTYANTARLTTSFTYPHAFIAVPVGLISFNDSANVEVLDYTNAGGPIVNRTSSTTGGEVRLYRDDSSFTSGDSVDVSLMWIGRWFT